MSGASPSRPPQDGRRLRPALVRAGIAAAIVLLGLATRRTPERFPGFVAEYGGDALWAALVYVLLSIVRPRASVWRLAFAAATVAFVVEGSQLLEWDWLNTLRATRLGALVLGQGFLWSDLPSYTMGVAIAAAVDALLRERGTSDARSR